MVLLWGRSGRKPCEPPLYVCSGLFEMKGKKRRMFEDTEQLDHAIKYSFMAIFFEWVKLHIDHQLMSIIGFVD